MQSVQGRLAEGKRTFHSSNREDQTQLWDSQAGSGELAACCRRGEAFERSLPSRSVPDGVLKGRQRKPGAAH